MIKAKNKDFMELYTEHHQALSDFCRSLERDVEDAKELMSETISRAFEGFERMKDRSKFKSYLFGIATNVLKEIIRKKSRQIPSKQVIPMHPKESSGAENHAIDQILKHIPDKQAEVFVLFEIADMSLSDIAKTLDTNLSTVKTRLSRARTSLSALLHDEFKHHITHF